ncbi:transcriptional coactivator p15/PC4 family protein [Microvirga sp. 3-52]|uniref:PC4/YdbC family ssDNA-binding protein n=1 Tax=Microvirga sp. 3-52 TaxID=2792425 RepID=UPI001AD2E01E|nr:PC4/YdbC family ssDNA-binding protein [Microvirga sp. 3-52]MBO1903981.1 transcriptional coactivator p15/PC4 family protein [Microvirga sp. 3-52]MBS7451595.1 transcriptional coactivator p15/PC4 family protein [Microvirga sp. 3-52]
MRNELPVTLAEWPRNSRETLRVRLDSFNGQTIIDCRSWWSDANGELRPGKSGLTLAVRHLPDLPDALANALVHARSTGLLMDRKGRS